MAAARPLVTTVKVTPLLAQHWEVLSWGRGGGGVGRGGAARLRWAGPPGCGVGGASGLCGGRGLRGGRRPVLPSGVRPPLPAPAFASVRPAAVVTGRTCMYRFLGDGLFHSFFTKVAVWTRDGRVRSGASSMATIQ